MTDRTVTPTEELPTMQDGAGGLSAEQKENEEKGDHFLQIQVGAAVLSTEQKEHVEKEEKEQKDQDPTVVPTSQRQLEGVHGSHKLLVQEEEAELKELTYMLDASIENNSDRAVTAQILQRIEMRQLEGVHEIYDILVQEDEAELKELTYMLDASIENNSDHANTAQLLQRIEMVQAGAAGLSADQKEHHEIQVGAAGLSAKQKKRKGKKEDKKKSKRLKEDEEKKRKGQIASVKKYMQSVHEKYDKFLDDENRAKLEKIAHILNAVDEDTWDDAVNSSLLERIELVKMTVKKRFDDDKMRGKMITQFETDLDQGAKERRAEAERSIAEAESRLAEADEIKKLVSELKTSVQRLEHQQSLVPTEEINRKVAMGQRILHWLEEKLEQLQDLLQLDYNNLVTNIDAWNKELLDKTFWDHSPGNKENTKMGRKPVQDFDNIKVERLIFNPMRTSFVHFIHYLRDRLCDHPQFGNIESKEGQLDQIYSCRLLEYQTTAAKQPPRWIILELRSGSAKADMYIRSDNLYIGGFANQKDQIYELSNSANDPLLKDSIPFGCSCDYPSLMHFERTGEKPPKGQDVERLKEIILNRVAVTSDVVAMSEYDHTKEDSTKAEDWKEIIKQVQIGIARTAICFSEVCRLLFLFSCVEEGWLSVLGSHLTDLLIAHMRHWKDISFAIRNDFEGRKFTETEIAELGMTYAFEGFRVLCLVLNAKGDGLLRKDDSKGDGPKPQPPPPHGNDKESKDDSGKGRSSTPPGPENESGNDKELKNDGGKGRSSTPPGPENEGGDSQGDGGHDSDKFQLSGQCLVEVFSIHTNTHLIKSISIYDDRCGKIIYKSSGVDVADFFKKRDSWLLSHTGRDSSDYMDELIITGPDRAMSALPWYIIEVDVGDEKGVFDLSWNWADRTVVNKPMTQSIFTSRGEAHVTSAVFSNAVQASIEVLLFVPYSRFYMKVEVQGNLVLQIEKFAIGSKMFQNDVEHGARLKVQKSSEMTVEENEREVVVMAVPLNRNVFALPVGCRFRVTGTLALRAWGAPTAEMTLVSIDRSIELKHGVESCKWRPSVSGGLWVDHAAILVNTTSPF